MIAATPDYTAEPPTRAAVDASRGAVVLDFGTAWCGWCRRAQVLLNPVFAAYPAVVRVRVEDGPGRPLGRSFGVKLWPTLIFLVDGREIVRLVRPEDEQAVRAAFAQQAQGATSP
ncbi:MAG: thioredoxin family protein [Pseudomonadales bacterium]